MNINYCVLKTWRSLLKTKIGQHTSFTDQEAKNQFNKSCFQPGTVQSFTSCTQESTGSRVKHMWL